MTEPDPLHLVLIAYLAMVAVMVGLWVLQLRLRNASIADVGFCFGFIAVVMGYGAFASGDGERKALVVAMAAVYAGRLGLHLLVNRVVGRQEDARYRRLRERWGQAAPVKMFWYFQLQAVAVAGLSVPLLVVIQNPRPPFALTELAGLAVWIVSVSAEALADRQLARFRGKPWNHDRVCQDGLWYYSRHPNYFFEWLHWWTYVVMAIGVPGWPLAWVGPLAMGWALLNVTGIPPAEEQALISRGEAYRRYQRTTNAFVPWFPKSPPPLSG